MGLTRFPTAVVWWKRAARALGKGAGLPGRQWVDSHGSDQTAAAGSFWKLGRLIELV